MKKLLMLFISVYTTINIAQESVMLRVKYKKGDVYSIKMKQTMTSAQMMMNNNMEMNLEVTDKKEGVFTSETKVNKVVMDMMQGGMQMSYDTSKKDQELDQMAKIMKTQIDPLLKVVITTKSNKLGKISDVIIEPNVPGSDQFKNESAILFPENPVKVNDTWTNENEIQGMKTSLEYKVTKITNDKVFLSSTGTISGVGTGTIKGTHEIDRNTGVTLKSSTENAIKAQGQEMNLALEVIKEKI